MSEILPSTAAPENAEATGCDRPIYRSGKWHYCGHDGKRCLDCGGNDKALSDDEIAAAIVRTDGAWCVGKHARIVDVVFSVLVFAVLVWWIVK